MATTFWQKVWLKPNCLVMQESQFDELCGLQQIAVSWSCIISFVMCLHSYTALKFHAFIIIYMTSLECSFLKKWIVTSTLCLLVKILQTSHIYSTLPNIHLYCDLHAVNIRQKIQAQLLCWVCDTVLQIGQHYIPSTYFYCSYDCSHFCITWKNMQVVC